jgi:predicted Zn-dependent protease
MKPGHVLACMLTLAATAFLNACATAPVTGRSQFIIISDAQATQLGVEAYQQIRAQTPVSKDQKLNAMVQEVGRRIAAVAEGSGFQWEFTLFEDDSPNAFALPGGKVGVNTGLFQVAKDEAQLAAVMGHEVAHAIARHASERMSREMALQGGLAMAQASSQTVAKYAGVMAQAATLGIVLPFGREQESEADAIGLIYMARAGYDPQAAVALWQNFAAYGGARQPEFMSTHPSPGNRIERLKSLMPQAMEIYRKQAR